MKRAAKAHVEVPAIAASSSGPNGPDKPPDFVVKLYQMFSELPPELIAWQSGRIEIPGPATKLQDALPKYFRHGKFTSFQRQLNNFGFHKKIAESSSKLRVYCRDDMVGYPPVALLELRRVPGGHGQAEWRGGKPDPSLLEKHAKRAATDEEEEAEEEEEDDARSATRTIDEDDDVAQKDAPPKKSPRCVSVDDDTRVRSTKPYGRRPAKMARTSMSRVVSTSSVSDLISCLEEELPRRRRRSRGSRDLAPPSESVEETTTARRRAPPPATVDHPTNATTRKPAAAVVAHAPRPPAVDEDDGPSPQTAARIESSATREKLLELQVPDRATSTNTIGTFAIPSRTISGPLFSDLATFRWVDRTASEASLPAFPAAAARQPSFRWVDRTASEASLPGLPTPAARQASKDSLLSTTDEADPNAAVPTASSGPPQQQQHAAFASASRQTSRASFGTQRARENLCGLASFADLGDDGTVDDLVEFLDKQVCGAVLSSDSVELSKSSRDLNLDLTAPDHLVHGDEDLSWGWQDADSFHHQKVARRLSPPPVAAGAPVCYFDD